MTEEVIKALPELLKNKLCTLKKASMDSANGMPMTNSKIKVICYDKIPNEYARGKGWSGVPKSNDALYIDTNGMWHFIEFKNGTIDKSDLYRKLYDSIIMLIDVKIIPNFEFVRNKINYILVYNSSNYGKVQYSEERENTYSYFQMLAEQEEKLFEIEKFEKYLFNETHTYSKTLFEERFVTPMEMEEGIV